MKTNINMIVAVDKNFGIGYRNKLLTHIPEDLKYFKNVTKGHVLIMGYNTYMSLPKRPLPDRTTIVLTRKDKSSHNELKDAIVCNSIDLIFEKLTTEDLKNKKVFVCGGESIYRQFMKYADTLYITHLFKEFKADTFFPKIEKDNWEISEVKADFENIHNKIPHIFTIYNKK